MKIGKFAIENSVSIETIRHYMDLDLIIPEKKGGHYDFDLRCKKDLEDILLLKKTGFTLHEIKSLFMFKRLGRLTPYQEEEYYIEFYKNKYESINREIEDLVEIKDRLEDNLNKLLVKKNINNFVIGIDINALPLLFCHKCKHGLTLLEGEIVNNQVMNGILKCKCQERYLIEEGILYGKNRLKEDGSIIDNDYLNDYINETSEEYLNSIYKGLEWIYKKIDFKELNNNVILELGSGIGFLLRTIYLDLPDDTLYIAVDNDIKRHKFLKKMLEKADIKKNILFICDDYLDIPIKDKLVDVLIDYAGTSNYSFNHRDCLIELVDHYVKEKAILIGGYLLFKNFSINSVIKEGFRNNFRTHYIKDIICKLKYKEIDECSLVVVNHGGSKYENFFTDDEEVYCYNFYGKR